MTELTYYRNTNEYAYLIEHCQAIKKARRERIKVELITMYAEIAEEILSNPLYEKHAKGNQHFLDTCFEDIGISKKAGYDAIAFYKKELQARQVVSTPVETMVYTWLMEHPEVSSWSDVRAFLPEGKLEKHECTEFENVARCRSCKRMKV